MKPDNDKGLPPTKWYSTVNGICGLLWAFGLPIPFWIFTELSLWIKIPVTAAWIVASGIAVERFIPRMTNPVIEWVYARLHGARRNP